MPKATNIRQNIHGYIFRIYNYIIVYIKFIYIIKYLYNGTKLWYQSVPFYSEIQNLNNVWLDLPKHGTVTFIKKLRLWPKLTSFCIWDTTFWGQWFQLRLNNKISPVSSYNITALTDCISTYNSMTHEYACACREEKRNFDSWFNQGEFLIISIV